jgi:flagellar biosynthesis/type III secretory pathway M-ring protein FliF/YscJ
MGMQPETKSSKLDMLKQVANYKKTIINFLLVILVFFLAIRPLMKSMKNLADEVAVEQKHLAADMAEYTQIAGPTGGSPRERILETSKSNHEKTQQVIKGWIGEQE